MTKLRSIFAGTYLVALAACEPGSWHLFASEQGRVSAQELVDANFTRVFTAAWTEVTSSEADYLSVTAICVVPVAAEFAGRLRLVPSDASLEPMVAELTATQEQLDSGQVVISQRLRIEVPLDLCGPSTACETDFTLELEGDVAADGAALAQWELNAVAAASDIDRESVPEGAQLSLTALD